jgi:hypothetical protein
MGWASGSQIMWRVMETAQRYIPNETQRCEFYREIIDAFEDQDWDTQDECLGMDPMFDAAMQYLHPDEEGY